MDVLDADLHVVPEDRQVLKTLAGTARGRSLRHHGGRATAASHAHLVGTGLVWNRGSKLETYIWRHEEDK